MRKHGPSQTPLVVRGSSRYHVTLHRRDLGCDQACRLRHDLFRSGIWLRLGARRDAEGITTQQTVEIARRTRQFGIIPEFSFVIGNPNDPDRDTQETLRFIREIKRINPDSEIIIQHYTPTPQPHKAGGEMYGNIDVAFPDTPAGWATSEWMNYTLRIDTHAPWLKSKTKQLIDNFEIVVASR